MSSSELESTISPASFQLIQHAEHLAVARLGSGHDLPRWATAATLMSITATAAETSIVCAASEVPRKVRHEGPFVAFEVHGPLDFSLTGVLSTLLAPLAAAQISVFTLSTYDTDWILIKADAAAAAREEWQRAGHTVTAATYS